MSTLLPGIQVPEGMLTFLPWLHLPEPDEEHDEVSGWNDLLNRARLHYQLTRVHEKHFPRSAGAT